MVVAYVVKPRRCPNCGAKLRLPKSMLRDGLVGARRDGPIRDAPLYFDVYCSKCGWSGEISPDVQFKEGEKLED